MAQPILVDGKVRSWLRAVLILALATGFSAEASASEAADAERTRGGALFARHCESCHGPGGSGHGIDAALFDPAPPALTPDRLRRHGADFIVARVRDGRPLDLAVSPRALRGRATDTEAIVAHLERLPTIDWRIVERGTEVFVDRCESCHGPSGRPQDTPPPGVARPRDLSDPAFQRATSDAELVEVVRHGRHGMPALVPRITDDDARAVAAFVRLLSPGMERYTRYCAACHGDDGRGAGSLVEGQRAPTVVFDRAYFQRHDPEHLRAQVWHMLDEQIPRMPHYRRRLTEADARAIVAYLLARD